MQLTLAEVARLVGGDPAPAGAAGAVAGMVAGYSLDSRSIRPNELFFAIRGEARDGHDFVLAALGAGALAAVVERSAYLRFAPSFRDRLLPVRDVTVALQTLAAAVRRRWGKKLVGVTGSAGKTGTKDMIARVLGVRRRVLKSEGNLNNHWGVPLSLLRLTPAHDVAVIEMGMNHAGEIARLAAIAAPQVGVVTNVGAAHLGNFRSVDEIAAAKRELIQALPPGGVAVLNQDDPRVARFGEGFAGRVVRFGLAPGAGGGAGAAALDLALRDLRVLGEAGGEFTAVAAAGGQGTGEGESARVRLPLLGRHNLFNAAAALAVGLVFGAPLPEGAAALAAMTPGPGRGRLLHGAGATIIDDCYNSNPAALENMINLLAGLPGTRRVLVAGEMLELGPASAEAHRRLGELAAQRRIDVIFAVRGAAAELLAGARAAGFAGEGEFFADAAACGRRLRTALRPGDIVLVKGSRGVRLERALEQVTGAEKGAGSGAEGSAGAEAGGAP